MLIKIAPDLVDEDLDAMASVFNAGRVDGVIIGNTTIDRASVEGHPLAEQAGGLSGEPLYTKSTTVLRKMRLRLDDKIPLVGVGGENAAGALVRCDAGAGWTDLVGWTLARGLVGLENMALIPGTVGAAPIQNIGAYGAEIGEFVESVEAFRRDTGQIKRLTR